jgi:hypothetical protein
MMHKGVTSWCGLRSGGATAVHDRITVAGLVDDHQEDRKTDQRKHDQHSSFALPTTLCPHHLLKLIFVHKSSTSSSPVRGIFLLAFKLAVLCFGNVAVYGLSYQEDGYNRSANQRELNQSVANPGCNLGAIDVCLHGLNGRVLKLWAIVAEFCGHWALAHTNQPIRLPPVGVAAFTIATMPARIAGGRSAHPATTAAKSGSVGFAITVRSPNVLAMLPFLLPPDFETASFPEGNCDRSNPIGVICFQVR